MASNDEQRSATTILTTAAQSIAARLIANETTAKFTKAEISTTNLFNQSVTELQVLTSLDNVQQTADINTVTVINNNTVNVNVAIDQTKAPNNYQMNSVGLFAVDGDGKEVLYSVTVLKDPVYIHQDAMGSALGIDLETVVGQASNVEISVNPAGAVTNEILKATLADYVKTDDVKSLIPATVIDGSKPADFKEAVTLEKGAVDGAGNAIATTKNVSDGDAETLKSAKDYADVQAGDKVKAADTANWQKQALFNPGGYSIGSVPRGSDYATYVKANFSNPGIYYIRDQESGMQSVDGATISVVDSVLISEGLGYYYAYGVAVSGDFVFRAISPTKDTGWKRSADVDSIDPSVMVKRTLTADDDVLTLDTGTYYTWGAKPKNFPATLVSWSTIVVQTVGNQPLDGKNVTITDTHASQLINTYSGSASTGKWSGWRMPNENSVVKDNGDDTVTINRKTYVPANAANVVDRNPNTGVVSKPTDFTNLTVNGGKTVATSDDLKSIEASAWRQLDNKYITPPSGYTLAPSTSILYKIDDSAHTLYLSGAITLTDPNASNTPVTVQLGSIIKSILTSSVKYLGYVSGYSGWNFGFASQSATNLTFSLVSGVAGIAASTGTEGKLSYVTYDELV